uniref:Uncharacterized protein n=1 Tax=Panagrolaimus sp. ES5 TaxID=591445 RepID=A0AC34F8A6_9BILA
MKTQNSKSVGELDHVVVSGPLRKQVLNEAPPFEDTPGYQKDNNPMKQVGITEEVLSKTDCLPADKTNEEDGAVPLNSQFEKPVEMGLKRNEPAVLIGHQPKTDVQIDSSEIDVIEVPEKIGDECDERNAKSSANAEPGGLQRSSTHSLKNEYNADGVGGGGNEKSKEGHLLSVLDPLRKQNIDIEHVKNMPAYKEDEAVPLKRQLEKSAEIGTKLSHDLGSLVISKKLPDTLKEEEAIVDYSDWSFNGGKQKPFQKSIVTYSDSDSDPDLPQTAINEEKKPTLEVENGSYKGRKEEQLDSTIVLSSDSDTEYPVEAKQSPVHNDNSDGKKNQEVAKDKIIDVSSTSLDLSLEEQKMNAKTDRTANFVAKKLVLKKLVGQARE